MEMNVRDRAEFLFATQNLKVSKREKWAEGTDYVASDALANEKVLVRIVEPHTKSGFVGADEVKSMLKVMRRKDCERGIIVGKRFTVAASEEMRAANIREASDERMPPVTSENVVLTINECINDLCRAKCGAVPLQESDCKGRLKESPCRVWSISEDVMFHYELGWIDLLKNDLRQLLMVKKAAKVDNSERGVC